MLQSTYDQYVTDLVERQQELNVAQRRLRVLEAEVKLLTLYIRDAEEEGVQPDPIPDPDEES